MPVLTFPIDLTVELTLDHYYRMSCELLLIISPKTL